MKKQEVMTGNITKPEHGIWNRQLDLVVYLHGKALCRERKNMNINFHYYVVKTLAHYANFGGSEANQQKLAYYS